MPLEKIVLEKDRAWAIWKVEENEARLSHEISSYETIGTTLTNSQKRLEWLAGRVTTKEVMTSLGLAFQGIQKDDYGKPFPKGCDFHLSLSHSYPYVAVLMDKKHHVGVDLEQPKEKLLRIASRIHHANELQDLGTDIVKHCIYWCAKESLIKFYGRKDLIFAENMFIEPFHRANEGSITGRIIKDGNESMIPLQYIVYPNFVLVFTCLS